MKVTTSDKYTLFKTETDFDTFFDEVSKVLAKYKNRNIILDVSSIDTTESQIKSLSGFAETQAENEKSFAVILTDFDADAFDEELNVVPTLVEAIDIIDMDEMTRDLGF
ncbi:hypothetical protein AXE80_02025 [Wenyingzhuangia fucanilytica]|uniref:Uncharacterized protein n=1 Tax=Wenyingzhuangia fucanilytica TaxID=1790137 RepID=A0A1B1Y318_9FLAO|nr:hypothetical protein [Wenyingzhuangia fucanilytica]ANW95137.1 hypothetical protein AXE80_02025 [Wenyingzhuangia fucanilytica]